MASFQPLFLVALVPPEPVLAEVWALKQEVHRLTGSRNAVGLPPHITLLPPLRQPAAFGFHYGQALAEFGVGQVPFSVSLGDFAWFGNRTLYVRVRESLPLQQLYAALQMWCATHVPAVPAESRPFTPHMTLATRDLPAEMVPELVRDFGARRYAATFLASSLTLFRHDGRYWEPVEVFPLGPGS